LSRVPNEFAAEMAICGPFGRSEPPIITELGVCSVSDGAMFLAVALYWVRREDPAACHL
jgi:hypothetical protein